MTITRKASAHLQKASYLTRAQRGHISQQPLCCLECHHGLDEIARPDRLFCSSSCRIRFNQRRLTRGATVYDLVMAVHDPSLSRAQARAAKKALFVVLDAFWNADTADGGQARYKPIGLVLNEVTGNACRLSAGEDVHSVAN